MQGVKIAISAKMDVMNRIKMIDGYPFVAYLKRIIEVVSVLKCDGTTKQPSAGVKEKIF
jgi:hypothetical protein